MIAFVGPRGAKTENASTNGMISATSTTQLRVSKKPRNHNAIAVTPPSFAKFAGVLQPGLLADEGEHAEREAGAEQPSAQRSRAAARARRAPKHRRHQRERDERDVPPRATVREALVERVVDGEHAESAPATARR